MPDDFTPDQRDIRRDIRMGDHGPDVRVLQANLNAVARAFDKVDNHVIPEDGEAGKHTLASARRAAFILGLPQSTLDDIAAPRNVVRQSVQRQIRHPDDRPKELKERGEQRRKEIIHHQEERERARRDGNLVIFDGRDCPGWIVRGVLIPARRDGIAFQVISGQRDPDYSEHLCYVMCGQPTCPGQCAGKGSNHSCPPSFKCVQYEGAVDVSPGAVDLQRYCRAHNLPLHGGGEMLGSADVPHFSYSGR